MYDKSRIIKKKMVLLNLSFKASICGHLVLLGLRQGISDKRAMEKSCAPGGWKVKKEKEMAQVFSAESQSAENLLGPHLLNLHSPQQAAGYRPGTTLLWNGSNLLPNFGGSNMISFTVLNQASCETLRSLTWHLKAC